jgi:macrolide-specific efflux system membrane fusion protein
MTVWTEVSEADVGRIRVGMPVYFTTDDEGRQGKLAQILPASSSASIGSGKVVLYTALFDVENADGALMAQMSAQVFFCDRRCAGCGSSAFCCSKTYR